MSQEQSGKKSDKPNDGEPKELLVKSETFEAFIHIQSEELQIRREEIGIRKNELALDAQKDTHAYEFSKEALGKQIEDRKDERTKRYSFFNSLRINLFWLLLILIILFGVAIYAGKEEIVVEVAKIIGTVAISVFGGYYAGYSRGERKANKND